MKKLIENIFELNRFIKIFIQLIVDGILIIISFLLAWYLRFDENFLILIPDIWVFFYIIMPLTLFIFFKLAFYKNVVRFISTSFIKNSLLGSTFSASLIYLSAFIFELYLPRSIPLIYLLLLLTFTCGVRLQLGFIYHYYMTEKTNKIAIIDTSKNSIKIANFLHRDNENKVIAFFDNKRSIIGTEINGIPVFNIDKLENIISDEKINLVLITSKDITRKLNQTLLNCIQKFKVEIKKSPLINEFTNFYDQKKLQDLSIEDLLGRNPIKPNLELLDKNIKNKVTLITGAGGSIGSELCLNILKREPKKIILFENSEYNLYKIEKLLNNYKIYNNLNVEILSVLGSIQDESTLNRIFGYNNIDTLYHAAAYKHVPLIEYNIIEGIKNNVYGTKLLIDLSIKYNVKKFILISSDKAVRPTNYMGATKRIAEILCLIGNKKQNNTKFCIVRFGNVLGSSGSVIPLFNQQISEGGPVTVTDPKIERYFMTIQEATELVIQASSMASKKVEIFILDMGGRIKILDLAKQMIKLSGFIPVIKKDKNYKLKSNELLIKITGLRSGEKLIEELVYKTKIMKTEHPRIMKTSDNILKLDKKLNNNIVKLINLCDGKNVKKITETLIKIDANFKLSKKQLQ